METKLDNNKRNPFARKLSFPLGEVSVTLRAQQALNPADIVTGVTRHARGDWGELGDADWQENDESIESGFQLISEYAAKDGTRFLVITAGDRSSTTVLLPEED
jgi:hypothetical protein